MRQKSKFTANEVQRKQKERFKSVGRDMSSGDQLICST